MKKITWVFVVLITFITNLSAFKTGQDKISGDLIGNTVQSSNEELSWTFRNGEPLEYAVISRKNVGTRKANRIYTTIYLRTRNTKDQQNRLMAEGEIELVYKKSRSGNQYFLSHINQLGFQIMPMSSEVEEAILEAESFWNKFKFALNYDDRAQVAEMINYPLTTARFGNFADSREMQKNFDRLFTFEVKQSLGNSILTPESKSKGKKFDYENDEYILKSDYDSQIKINERANYFTVKKVNGKFKITGMKEMN